MKFLIVTHVVHGKSDRYFAYGPYVREMNIWNKFANEITVVAPCENIERTAIHLEYEHRTLILKNVEAINFQSFSNIVKSVFEIPRIIYRLFLAMNATDHIHLRCPGNVGLLGCMVQIFFPNKKKSAKYAGNWDPNSKQPLSYRLQKWILSNTFLTKNMKVLVYGEWPNQSRNIKSFFTASYYEKDKILVPTKDFRGDIKFLFVGSLVVGKNPLYAVKLVHQLVDLGVEASLELYGEGEQRQIIEQYILENNLQYNITLKGNQNEEVLCRAYEKSHFLILPSKSEGWPKAVAEAMFWGSVPIASRLSCVPQMLGHGDRGLLLSMEILDDVPAIVALIDDVNLCHFKSDNAVEWSRKFTLDLFESEISDIL